MAIAWLLSFSFIKYPDYTLSNMKQLDLDKWTYNKTIQKIIESKRVNDDIKEQLKKQYK